MKDVDFLDITMHLESGTYEPFRKEELPPIYVNKKSNHPPVVTKNIPAMIEKRLNNRCSNEQAFNRHRNTYERALRQSGYNATLKYNENQPDPVKRKKERYPKKFWFNPPYNAKVRTSVGREVLKMLDKHFPKGTIIQGIHWHKHFNRHTVKVSYSCTRNIAKHISAHNQRILRKSEVQAQECNCQIGPCPVDGKCLVEGLVYTGTIDTKNNNYTYYGSTGNTFKERFNNHKQDLNTETKTGTMLSNKYWELKKENPTEDPQIKWQIINKCHRLTAGTPICDVCLTEKSRILLQHKGPPPKPPDNTIFINQRSELFSKCRHRRRFLLRHYKKLYEKK